MSKVWVLTVGSYSDYHIVGVCSSKEAAEALAAPTKGSYDEVEVAEWVLDDLVPRLTVGVDIYRTADGLFSDWTERVGVTTRGQFQASTQASTQASIRWAGTPLTNQGEMIAVSVDGSDFDRVRKVASERKARVVAEFDILMAIADNGERWRAVSALEGS